MFSILRFVLYFVLIGTQVPVFSLEPSQGSREEQKLIHYTLYYPPYWDSTESPITGLHARLSNRLYAQAGLDIDMESVPYARIHQRLFPDNLAIAAYGANPLTDDQFLFPIPQTTIELKIYGIHAEPVDRLDQLVGKDIAIKRGFPLGGYEVIRVEKKYNTASTNTVDQAIRMLLLKRVDYVITLNDPFQKDVKNIDLGGKKIWSRTLEKLDGWPIAIVKSHPRAKELNERIKRAYNELREAGVITYKDQRLLLTEDL
jgi:ABC-type amino acid transport substrate-binding protein